MHRFKLLLGVLPALASPPGMAQEALQLPNPISIVKRLFSDVQGVGSTLGSALQAPPGHPQPPGAPSPEAAAAKPAAGEAVTQSPPVQPATEAQLRAELDAMKAKVEALEAARVQKEAEAKAAEDQRLAAAENARVEAARQAEAAEVAARLKRDQESAAAASAAARQQSAQPKPAATVAADPLPSRPQIPLAISDAVWAQIEASDAYRKLPKPQSLRITWDESRAVEYTGSSNRNLPASPNQEVRATTEITPIGDKCTLTRTEVVGRTSRSLSDSYTCGAFALGSVSNGKPSTRLDRIDAVEGSLFPLRIGNRQAVTTFTVSDTSSFQFRLASTCEVVGSGQAREVDPRLTGRAWKLHCKTSSSSPASGDREAESDDYYLEELATRLSTLQKVDFGSKSRFLPTAGSQTVLATEGPYASRNTITYGKYDWVSGPGVVAQISPAVTPQPALGSDPDSVAARREREEKRRQDLAEAERRLAEVLRQEQDQRAARQAAAQQQQQQQQAAGPAPGLFGGMLGGLASRVMDRNMATVNSAMAGTGAVGSAFGSVHNQIASKAKEGIAKDLASTDESRAGFAVASALTAGIGANAGSGPSGGGDKTPSTPAGGAGGKGGAELQACKSVVYPGNKSDPQVYSYDAIAQFDLCAHKATGDNRYLVDGNNQCKVLDGLLKATRGSFQAHFCQGPNLKL
jgi:hypothetical protein